MSRKPRSQASEASPTSPLAPLLMAALEDAIRRHDTGNEPAEEWWAAVRELVAQARGQ